jgi:large subunit ribosomal protein L9
VDVVLLQDVEKVGLRGEVVSVSRGYMRNYLQPRKLAEPATPALVTEIQRRDAERARHEARSVEQAHAIAETLTKTVLRFEVKAGTQGVLFGSITPTDVADELWRVRKVRVDRRKVDLPEPIKRVGRYNVPIEVFQDVRVEVKTLVVPEGGELPDEDFEAVDTNGQGLEPASADEAAGADEVTRADEAALLERHAVEPADAELGLDARDR